jgi:Pentapeptide repeats (9 copies)
MSVAFLYHAVVPRPLKEQRAIVAAAKRCVKKRTWANEGFFLTTHTARLIGSTKLFPATVGSDDMLAAAADADYLVEVLQQIAREYGLTWQISCGDELGSITADCVDPRIGEFIAALRATAGEVRPPAEPTLRKKATPRPRLLPKKDIAALRQRWTEARLAALRPLIDAGDRAALLASCGEHLGLFDLRGVDLGILPERNDDRPRPQLVGCDFSHGHIKWGVSPGGRRYRQCRFDGVELSTWLAGAFVECTFICADFDEVRISAWLADCDFTHAHFSRLQMRGQVLLRCRFAHARMRKAQLGRARFTTCDFSEADLAGAEMADAAFVDCGFTGAIFAGVWYADTVFKGCSGLDKKRMSAERHAIMGEPLGDPPVITKDLAHPDEAETVDAWTRQRRQRKLEELEALAKPETRSTADREADKRLAATIPTAELGKRIANGHAQARVGMKSTDHASAADAMRAADRELQLGLAWLDRQKDDKSSVVAQMTKQIYSLVSAFSNLTGHHHDLLVAHIAANDDGDEAI